MNARYVIVAAWLVLTTLVLTGGPATDAGSELPAFIAQVASAPGAYGLVLHAGGERWYLPLEVYPTAWLLSAGVPRDIALVTPSLVAACGVLWLTHRLGLRLPLPGLAAASAAALLVLMPGFIAHTRVPGGGLLLVTALLAWCVAVAEYDHRRRAGMLIGGAGVLGVAAYTHPSGWWSVAIFVLLGATALRRAKTGWSTIIASAAMPAAVCVPLAIWVLLHPDAYPDTIGRWAIHAAHVRSPLDGLVAVTRWHVVARRASEYWNYFSPTFLFASGQLFAWWMVILVPLGLWVRPQTVTAWLLAAAFLASPAAGVMLDTGRTALSALPLLPFGALLAVVGSRHVYAWGKGLRIRPGRRTVASPSSN
jgi:hypothetical protein